MKYLLLVIAYIFSFSCYAEDISQDAAGNRKKLGYLEKKISDGIYEIHFSAPRLLFSSKQSWNGWNRRATLLCNGNEYRILNKKEYLSAYISDLDSVQQKYDVQAYAICPSINLSDSEIEKVIHEYYFPKELVSEETVSIDEALVSDCKRNIIKNKEASFDEATKLFVQNRYTDALNCLENIISTDSNEFVNKKAYSQLGLMYEVGLGVPPDKKMAKKYYKKSEQKNSSNQ